MAGCVSIYEWSTASTIGDYTFLGVADNGYFDTPFFNSPDVQNSTVVGRVQGEFVLNVRNTATGSWGFNWFDDSSWLTSVNGFGDDDTEIFPNAITGGSGQWAGYTGTVTNNVVSTDPFVIEWSICPEDPAPALTECATVYEWSTNDTIEGTLFSGVSSDGIFDTPFFNQVDVTGDGSDLLGSIKGKFGVSGEISLGIWSFNFFDSGDNVVSSYGFTDGSKGAPGVITGGTGAYSGIIGELAATVITDDPFILQWDMCPMEPVTFDECTTVWELSKSGQFGNHTFAGSNEGRFETPFYSTMKDALDEGEPDGVVGGRFFTRGDASPGNWNFGFFDDGSWVSARTGFGDTPTPHVLTGGTGRFAGATGTVTSCVANEDPDVYRFDICPPGIDPQDCPDPSSAESAMVGHFVAFLTIALARFPF